MRLVVLIIGLLAGLLMILQTRVVYAASSSTEHVQRGGIAICGPAYPDASGMLSAFRIWWVRRQVAPSWGAS